MLIFSRKLNLYKFIYLVDLFDLILNLRVH